MKIRLLFTMIAALLALVGGALMASAEHKDNPPVPPTTSGVSPLAPLGTAFTYQGRLTTSGNPANGQYDLQFSLFEAASGGSQVGSTFPVLSQTVSSGLFTTQLDFGASAFQGDARWLEIAVRQSGGGSYTTLSPRQSLTAAPYALSLMPGAVISGTIVDRPALTVSSTVGTGLYGFGGTYGVFGESAIGDGVVGASSYSSGMGVFGHNSSSGYGVYGYSASGGTGVYGLSNGGGIGVRGESTTSNGVVGNSYSGIGVFGGSESGAGMFGESNSGPGVRGISTSSSGVSGDSISGYGVEGATYAANQAGVYGSSVATTNGIGVIGEANNGTGAIGVDARSNNGTGIYARGGTWAGYFQGNVHVTGNLSKGGGSFKIDHPLDPANKYLYHSFVESPDMMDIYNGNVTTDANGEAVVTMPAWFETLNRDFRYQLTVIGQFAQAIVSSEMKDNHFTIKTDKPRVKVSWQVTGIRHDPYADKYRIPLEQDKPANERGYYLHPDVYGQPKTMSVDKNTREQVSKVEVSLPGGK